MAYGVATIEEDALVLACLKGVARVAAVLHDEDGLCVLTAEMPYDAMTMLGRCSEREVQALVMAIS